MEIMTHGWWRPSPGSVYPLLEELVREGTLRKRDDGRYELVDAHEKGWGWLPREGPRNASEVAQELAGLTTYLEELKRTHPSVTDPIRGKLDDIADRLKRLKDGRNEP